MANSTYTTGTNPGTVPDVDATIDETDRLIASDKIEGTSVYGQDGEKIGSVYNFMVDKRSGKASYAVMSFGGFLGIGERYHPLPWDTLKYDQGLGGYIVNLTREQLEGAPHYGRDEEPWGDPTYGRGVYGYYGLMY
ncbi:MAG: PRC-barrel domain-containing protein [Pararhodobacter sp.]